MQTKKKIVDQKPWHRFFVVSQLVLTILSATLGSLLCYVIDMGLYAGQYECSSTVSFTFEWQTIWLSVGVYITIGILYRITLYIKTGFWYWNIIYKK